LIDRFCVWMCHFK